MAHQHFVQRIYISGDAERKRSLSPRVCTGEGRGVRFEVGTGVWVDIGVIVLYLFVINFCCMSQCLCLTYDVPCSSNFVALIVYSCINCSCF